LYAIIRLGVLYEYDLFVIKYLYRIVIYYIPSMIDFN